MSNSFKATSAYSGLVLLDLSYISITIFFKVETTVAYMLKGKHSRTLHYLLETDDFGEIMGGEWLKDSKKKHPDFLWVPSSPESANPEISFSNVKLLVMQSI